MSVERMCSILLRVPFAVDLEVEQGGFFSSS